MAFDIHNLLEKTDSWMARHWRACLLTMLGIVAMQQCTISSLQYRLERYSAVVGQPVAHEDSVANSIVSVPADNVSDSVDVSTIDTTSADESLGKHSNLPFFAFLLVVGIAVYVVWYSRRNALYPIGLWVGGRLRQAPDGTIFFSMKVKNRSTKEVEVNEPIINFKSRSNLRKFRAAVPSIPIVMQAGTTFETQISLNGLIERNPELMQAYAVSLTISTNGRRHSTPPSFIRFKEKA